MINYTVEYQLITEMVCQMQLRANGKLMTFRQVFNAWRKDTPFVIWYNNLIAQNGMFDAIYWEHPPVNTKALDKPYEFILSDGRSLRDVYADKDAFSEHFRTDTTVVDFDNLRGDAHLIVPCPNDQQGDYTHLYTFTNKASKSEVLNFWKRVGKCCIEYMNGNEKRWLSTAGNGVYWLHVRLDTRPKYYKNRGYKKWKY